MRRPTSSARRGRSTHSLLFVLCLTAGCGATSSSPDDANPDDGGSGGSATSGAAVGESCLPADFENVAFAGFAANEVNVETNTSQCASRICLVNHFQGRVGCPYGQADGEATCLTPSGAAVAPAVAAQLLERAPDDTVHCSCRCDGPDASDDYCTCPSGMECVELVAPLGLHNDAAGSYCIQSGMAYDKTGSSSLPCDEDTGSCAGR